MFKIRLSVYRGFNISLFKFTVKVFIGKKNYHHEEFFSIKSLNIFLVLIKKEISSCEINKY